MEIAEIIKELVVRTSAISAERDKLNDLISETKDLREVCNKALEALSEASEALSELV